MVMLQGSDWLLLKREELRLCIGDGGLSRATAEVLPSGIIASVSLKNSPYFVAPGLSGSVTVDSCSSQITVSFSRTAGWYDVPSDAYLESGFVSEVAFFTTES